MGRLQLSWEVWTSLILRNCGLDEKMKLIHQGRASMLRTNYFFTFGVRMKETAGNPIRSSLLASNTLLYGGNCI